MTSHRTTVGNLSSLEGYATDEECQDDIHVCKSCKLVFTDLQEYVQHKINHDNFKMSFSRKGTNRRTVLPKLIQKDKVEQEAPTSILSEDQTDRRKKWKRGRKRKGETTEKEEVESTNIITEKPSYVCTKCDQTFNREATLKRHIEYVHDADSDYVSKIEEIDDDEDDCGNIISIGRVAKSENAENEDSSTEQWQDEQTVVVKIPETQARLSKQETKNETEDRPFVCELCPCRFKELNVLKTHMLTHSNKRSYQCACCPLAFKTKGSLKRHLRRHTGERPYVCEVCKRAFTEAGALTRHLKSRVSCLHKTDNDLPRYGKRWGFTAVTNDPATERGIKENPLVQVTVAGSSSSSVDGMENKGLPEEGQPLEMEESPQVQEIIMEIIDVATDEVHTTVSPSQEHSLLHDQTAIQITSSGDAETIVANTTIVSQATLTPTQCQVCFEDLNTIDALRLHLATHLADVHLKCSLCHYLTQDREEFNKHMVEIHNSDIRVADTSDLKYQGTVQLDDADKASLDAKVAVKQLAELPSSDVSCQDDDGGVSAILRGQYKCPVCSKSFRGTSNLRMHMKSHTGDRRFKCPTCEKSFVTKDALTKHAFIHSNDRQYKCGECGKLFKRDSHVREHLKIHNTSRPFSCQMCDKSFKNMNALKVHHRTHMDVLPYVCSYCGRRFREKGSLIRHVRMHTGERPFSCPHCNKTFSEHGTLNRHLKAKVPCSQSLRYEVEVNGEETHTVLTEFSSVVADTQQYLETEGEEEEEVETEEGFSIVKENVEGEHTEYVVLETDIQDENIHNVEIITDGQVDSSLLESLQVTEDYIVITDQNESMKIYDSKTGEPIATMPLSSLTDVQGQVINIATSIDGQVIMAPNEIEAVAMQPLDNNIDGGEEQMVGVAETEVELVQQAMIEADVLE